MRLLGVMRETPLLVERRAIADAAGRPVEATESRYPGDRYALDVRLGGGGARLEGLNPGGRWGETGRPG